MNLRRSKYELFCWSGLLTLIVLSCLEIVPWSSTAVWAVALAIFMRAWVWVLRHNLLKFHHLYSLAADTICQCCDAEVVRHWTIRDDEIERSYRLNKDEDDDDDDDGGLHVCADPV